MNTNRELLRAEIKTTTYHRRMVKARAKTLFQDAQRSYEAAESEEGYMYQRPSYKRSIQMSDAATSLRWSRASYARSLNIASGLIRGIPYKSIEAKCRVAPNANEILSIIHAHSTWVERGKWDLERVKTLIS